MNDKAPKFTKPNEAWILYRSDFHTIQEGHCNSYFLLDVCSNFCFGHVVSDDIPSKSEFDILLQDSYSKSNAWPKQILISKKDPSIAIIKSICLDLNVPLTEHADQYLRQFIREFIDSLDEWRIGKPTSEEDREELEMFIPHPYDPCSCGSDKKFKFCCQKAFHDITFAMCAAEEGKLQEALKHMALAESKVGKTAEILCRYAICWSFFDQSKFYEYLIEAQKLDENHPRTNYILGLESVAKDQFSDAIKFYQKAIEHYPKADKYHLNETYNNLGSVYCRLGKFQEARDAWEKALVLYPKDKMVMRNLFECIYLNDDLPEHIRTISPFIKKYLDRQYSV